jgi:hypothetical protein
VTFSSSSKTRHSSCCPRQVRFTRHPEVARFASSWFRLLSWGCPKTAPSSTHHSSVHSRFRAVLRKRTAVRSLRSGAATSRLVPSLSFLPTSTAFSARAPQACCILQPTMGFAPFQTGPFQPRQQRWSSPKVSPECSPKAAPSLRRRLLGGRGGWRLSPVSACSDPKILPAAQRVGPVFPVASIPFEGFPSFAAVSGVVRTSCPLHHELSLTLLWSGPAGWLGAFGAPLPCGVDRSGPFPLVVGTVASPCLPGHLEAAH